MGTSSKTDYISEKFGFAEGVASAPYLSGFGEAEEVFKKDAFWREDRACKKPWVGTIGNCKLPKKKEQKPLKQGSKSGLMIAGGVGLLATGVAAGAVGGMMMANGKAQGVNDDLKQDLERTYKANTEAKIREKESAFEEERATLEKTHKESEEKIQSLEIENKTLKEAAAATEKEFKEISDSKASLEKELDKVVSASGELAKKFEAQSETLKSAEIDGEQFAALSKDNESLQSKIKQLETEKAGFEAQLEDVNKIFAEKESETRRLGNALSDSQELAKSEKAKFNEVASAIDANETDSKRLAKKVSELKKSQAIAEKRGEELKVANEKVDDLTKTKRALEKGNEALSGSIEELKAERIENLKKLTDLTTSSANRSAEDTAKITELQGQVAESSRSISNMQKAVAENTARLKVAETELIKESKRAIAAENKLLQESKKTLDLETELGITRKESEAEIKRLQETSRAELEKAYKEKADVLAQSPESFSRNKMRRSSRSPDNKILSYSVEEGINPKELDDLSSPFWQAPANLRQRAMDRAVDRIVEIEEERTQGEVAGAIAKQFKETPLAMSGRGGEKVVDNLRKRTKDLEEAAFLVQSIADPSTLVPTDKGKVAQTRMQEWKGAYAPDVWALSSEDSPTFQLLENEAIIAEAKLRDVYVFKQSQSIKSDAKAQMKDIMNSSMSPQEKAAELKGIHRTMAFALKEMNTVATGDRDSLFAAIKSVAKRKDSADDRCWEGYEPTPGSKPFDKGSCQQAKKKGKTLAEDKVAKVMGKKRAV